MGKKNANGELLSQFIDGYGQQQDQGQAQPQPAQPARRTKGRLAHTDKEKAQMAKRAAVYAALAKPFDISGRRQRPDWHEPRSQRAQLLIKPSIYKALCKIADSKQISFNHLTELAFTYYLENNHTEGQD